MRTSGPSSSVIAAAVVGILLALFGILSAVTAVVGVTLLPQPANSAAIPPFAKSMVIAMMVFFAGLATFGIFTSVSVLRLKNWARISMLVWGGIMTVFSGLALIFMAFMPLPEPSGDSPLPFQFIRIAVSLVYGIPVLIGIWWLILFNQQAIKKQFLSTPSAEGLPSVAPPPSCPLPLAILAGFWILSAGFSLLLPLTKFPLNMLLFGHLFRGAAGATLFFLSVGIILVGAIGMLRLQRWSYPLLLGFNFFGMASGTFSVLSPSYERNMQEIFSQMSVPESPVTQVTFAQTRVFGILGLLPIVFLIWFLLYFHNRFVEACAVKDALRGNQA
ncbi:MAG TPA: hypothetical protein VJX70_10925 [Candidatus Acidoferrum sp.]|nr:hypothetical protein [Candidatus Acidoferrum sp.]